jgi:diguanylate cyclase (GGDEF)-like protein
MPELIAADIVQRIADFSCQRDSTGLEASLVATLDELLAPQWAALYRAEGNEAAPELACAMVAGKLLADPLDDPLPSLLPDTFAALPLLPGVATLPIRTRSSALIGYLAIKRERGIGAHEKRIIADLLRIYDNTLALLREAQFDRLTGLLNRHTFDTQLDRVLEMARRTSRQRPSPDGRARVQRFFLGEIDIDHFKLINDHYGHLYGDEVLLLIARLLKSTFRKNDLVFRFGGEEFVVILVADDIERATLGFERLRRRIETYAFPQVGQVTVSAGLTEIGEADVPVQILGQADQALYYAKNHGRNRVCFYEALVDSGDLAPYSASEDVTMF